jgi:RNA polymerase sigma-70 factor (ECF subfamily)
VQEAFFIEKLEQHRDEFYAYIYRQIWDKSQVDDIFSQAMLTAWEKRNSFKDGTNFRAWVYKIITFKCFNNNKKEAKNIIHFEDLGENYDSEDPSTEPYPKNMENWLQDCDEAIPEALNHLNEKERACFLLRTMEELSYKEISDATDLPMGTVMTHLHRARKKLKNKLMDFAHELGWQEKKAPKQHISKKVNQKANPNPSTTHKEMS